MAQWVDPTTSWIDDAVENRRLEALRKQGELLSTWPAVSSERESTYCFRLGHQYHIWQPGLGGITFTASEPALALHPLDNTDRTYFWTLVARSWLPAIYPLWGRQVLHASAAVDADGTTIGFSGPSGAGKSTLAYALGQRAGWSIVADDTIAFSCPNDQRHSVTLHPLRLQSRLRTETARHFGKPHEREEEFAWPAVTPVLVALYILDGSHDRATTAISREPLSNSYAALLNQAHAMSLTDAVHNQQLMRDYATLAANVEIFRLAYPRSFDRLDRVLDSVESHVRELKARRTENPACSGGATVAGHSERTSS